MSEEARTDAFRTGRRAVGKAGLVGLGLAYLLLTLLCGPLFIFNIGWEISVSSGLLVFGTGIYCLGGLAGYLIRIKRWPPGFTAVACAFLIVWISILTGGLVEFLISSTHWNLDGLISCTLKPSVAVTWWGGIPIIVLGIWAAGLMSEYE